VEMVLRTEELMETIMVVLMETIMVLMEMIMVEMMETIMVEMMEVLMVQMIPLTIQTSNFSSLEPQPLNKETTCTTMITLIVNKILTTQN
jgi:hypothetical protein